MTQLKNEPHMVIYKGIIVCLQKYRCDRAIFTVSASQPRPTCLCHCYCMYYSTLLQPPLDLTYLLRNKV